jgi:diacylglycerol kinase (ATP)
METGSAKSLKGKQGIPRVIAAAGNSIKGLSAAWKHEAAFREECFLLVFFIPGAFILGRSSFEVAMLLFSCFLVLIVELLNTGIEVVVDRISMDRHELSGRAKDVASAAVFISLLQVPLIWGAVALDRFM